MPTVRILRQAAEEARGAAEWYDEERPGLGAEFARAMETALDLIAEDLLPLAPLPGPAGGQGAKRLTLRRFPYDIVVIDRPAERVIVAVAHHSRKPGYWRNRLRP